MRTLLFLKKNVFETWVFLIGLLVLSACDDGSDENSYDSGSPVEVISISPLEGAAKSRLYQNLCQDWRNRRESDRQ